MSYLRSSLILIWTLSVALPAICPAADVFVSEQQESAFLRVLRRKDPQYDPAERMIRRPFSSPGYHTTLKGGYVHPTRDSLDYAVALLDSGEPDRAQRAQDILRRVISLQDQDPNSRTYGIWSWFLEEPLDKMSPPDWNWADFCGTQLLQVALDHMHRLPPDMQQQVKNSILHAAHSIKRRDVGPGYTNIAVMGTYVTLVAGELFEVNELKDYGKARLKRFHDHTLKQGSFSEYNSPTYTCVAIEEISRMRQHVRDPQSRELLKWLNWYAWYHVARHFHPPTRQWSGPHSRCYSTLLGKETLAFIQRATDRKVGFMSDAEAWQSIDAHRIDAACHPEHSHYFTWLPLPREEVETFARNAAGEHDIIGTTYLDPHFTLGSVNIGDLWNQRRPLLAYWNTDTGVVAMRLRCLHDGYDYASASIFTVQDKADVLGAVVFATDRGDTHISLDRLKNATIKAKDLRLRLELEGSFAGTQFGAHSAENFDRPFHFLSGPIACHFKIGYAGFDDLPVRSEIGRDAKNAYIDIVLYQAGLLKKTIDFREIDGAAVIFGLSIRPHIGAAEQADPFTHLRINRAGESITASWHRTARPDMSVRVPLKPCATSRQRKTASADLAGKNPWKAPG